MQNIENKGEGCAKSGDDRATKPERSYYYDDAHGYEEYDPKRDAELDEDADEIDD